MKISRFKKSHKTLTFFSSNFEYREPYQILIDGTFCQAALKNQVNIEEQLRKYIQAQIKLLTTQCIILEAEALGSQLIGATLIVKKFYVHKCGHEGKPISATDCIKSMTKDSRYIVASQDRLLQEALRKVPGRCLLYLHKATPVLEAPSKASKKYVQKKSQQLQMPESLEQKIVHMKNSQGLSVVNDNCQKKRRGPKNPNPLSCKKSKKPKQINSAQNLHTEKTIQKSKRKRIKLPAHVKAELKGTLTS